MAEIDRIERVVGRLNAFAGITPASPNGFTQLNDAARELVKEAATELRLLLDELSRLRGREEEQREDERDAIYQVAFENRQVCLAPSSIQQWDHVIGWLSNVFGAQLPSDRAAARAIDPTRQKEPQQ